mgnify:CR=1 FL=1
MNNLASYLDLANHRPTASKKDIQDLCQKVLKYGFNSAFVNPYWVKLAKSCLQNSRVGTVISFPLGQETTNIKIKSSLEAVKKGADELDVSTNIALLKNNQPRAYLKEMKKIIKAVKIKNPQVIIKFIIETGCLTEKEIKKASLLVLKSKADFVKTCSGFGPRGATFKDVKVIKGVIGDKIKIKVAGGIRTSKQAQAFIKAGASQIGTSKAVEIVTEK